MFALMVIVLFFFREFGRIVVTFCINFDTSIIILLILITVFRGFSIPELQDWSKLFHSSLLTLFGSFSFFNLFERVVEPSSQIESTFRFLGLLFLLSQKGFQLILPLGQIQNQGLELSVLSLEILNWLFEIHDAEINSEE